MKTSVLLLLGICFSSVLGIHSPAEANPFGPGYVQDKSKLGL